MIELIELSNEAEVLLSKLWRGDSVHQIGTLKDKYFKNIPVKSLKDATNQASRFTEQGYEVYFACAEFKSESSRKAENVLGAWGYWFDIDCGEVKAKSGSGYINKKEANTALIAFLKQSKLPYPDFIVDSGNGLHIYFCSDEFIPKDKWLVGANKLKALTEYYSLIVDPTRATDIASVLRFPNTKNFKNPSKPKLVKMLYPKRGKA